MRFDNFTKTVIFVWVFLVLAIASECARADTRTNLLIQLNEIIDDSDDSKMSEASKIIFLDQIGKEYGRRGLLIKRDTIITVALQETYALNADFAGGIHSAYWKNRHQRRGIPIIGRDSSFNAPDVDPGELVYGFVDEDGQFGLHAIPIKEDTIVLLYFAYPANLSAGGTEWDIAEHYEGAAILHVAERILLGIPTIQGQAASVRDGDEGDALLGELRNPPTQTVQLGVTNR